MANKENVTQQIEPEVEAKASALFRALGLGLSTATGIFYRQDMSGCCIQPDRLLIYHMKKISGSCG